MNTIEIFKTNVDNKEDSNKLIKKLCMLDPNYNINFDIDDCDRILRIESKTKKIKIESIINVLNENSFNCEVLN